MGSKEAFPKHIWKARMYPVAMWLLFSTPIRARELDFTVWSNFTDCLEPVYEIETS